MKSAILLYFIGIGMVFSPLSEANSPSPSHLYRSMSASERYAFWAQIYNRINSGASCETLLKVIPKVSQSLAVARQVSSVFWTDSVIMDEIAQEAILNDNVLRSIGIPGQRDQNVIHVSAGVMHSYGYLLSQVVTKYGLKGKRWIELRVDERLGLPAGTFDPFGKGEFLSNLTFVLNQIIPKFNSFQAKPRDLKLLKKHMAPGLEQMVNELRLGDKYMGALREEVVWQKPNGQRVVATIGTHLVQLNSLSDYAPSESIWLVYDVTFDGQPRRFVTAFPVTEDFAAAIIKTPSSVGKAFAPRFNLYIDQSWSVVNYRSLGFTR